MPDDRTFVTELATALGMLGGTEITEAVKLRSPEVRLSDEQWDRLEDLTSSGTLGTDAHAAFENGRAFLDSPDALRGRRPILVEWTGGRRPPGDEVAPIDLRVDHVFLVSCKYLSANIANPSPARLFDGLLATAGDWVRGDWYLETAPEELKKLYLACKRASGEPDLPDDPVLLRPEDRRRLRRALPDRSLPEDARPAYGELCRAVSLASAKRWNEAISRFGNPEQVFWRLLRIGSAPYYLLGASSRSPLRLRISSPWDWRQDFKFRSLEVAAASAGQPQVDWVGTYERRSSRRQASVRGHIEVRWSHGRFAKPPEAKIYLDTPTDRLPGYYPLCTSLRGPDVPVPEEMCMADTQRQLFDDLDNDWSDWAD
jgi:hypothetical protein